MAASSVALVEPLVFPSGTSASDGSMVSPTTSESPGSATSPSSQHLSPDMSPYQSPFPPTSPSSHALASPVDAQGRSSLSLPSKKLSLSMPMSLHSPSSSSLDPNHLLHPHPQRASSSRAVPPGASPSRFRERAQQRRVLLQHAATVTPHSNDLAPLPYVDAGCDSHALQSPTSLAPTSPNSRSLPPLDSPSTHAWRGSTSSLKPSVAFHTASTVGSSTRASTSMSHLHLSVGPDSSRAAHLSVPDATSPFGLPPHLILSPAQSPSAGAFELLPPMQLASPQWGDGASALSTPQSQGPQLSWATTPQAHSTVSTPSSTQRSSSLYHFSTPKKRPSRASTLHRIIERGGHPSLVLPNTREHIRSPSLTHAIASPTRPHPTNPWDDDVDPIAEYHQFVCREAEDYQSRATEQRMRQLRRRRRSSVLPVPKFSATGELETSYVQHELEKRTRVTERALACLAALNAVSAAVWGETEEGHSVGLGLRVMGTVWLLCHAAALRLWPQHLAHSAVVLDLCLLATTSVLTLLTAVSTVDFMGDAASDELARQSLLMLLLFQYLVYFGVLRLAFRLAVGVAAVVLALWLGLTWALSPSSALTRAVLSAVHASALLCILHASHKREKAHRRDVHQQHLLFNERTKAETLLQSMLPARILQEYLDGRVGHVSAVATIGFIHVELGVPLRQRFHSRSSLSDDSDDPTAPARPPPVSKDSAATDMIKRLHDTFKRMDAVVSLYAARGVAKIETVSNTYMLCSGLLTDSDDHAAAMLDVCLETLRMIASRTQSSGPRLHISLRIGVATGPVVGGIIGSQRKFFRLFGDTVNTAARMSTTAKAGEITLTQATLDALGEGQRAVYNVEAPRLLHIKGKGEMPVYRLLGTTEERRPAFSKAVMNRGSHVHDEARGTVMQHHSFVYHHLLHMTKLHRFTLAYTTPDTAIERCFQAEYAQLMTQRRRTALVGCSLCALLVGGLCLVDADLPTLVLVPSLLGLILVQLAVTCTPYFLRHFQPIVAAGLSLALLWVVALEVALGGARAFPASLALQGIYLFVGLLAHLQFRYLAPIACAGYGAFAGVSVWAGDAEAFPFLAVLLTLAASLFVARAEERRHRRHFLLAYAMEREQQQMEHFLSNLLPKFVLDALRQSRSAKRRTPGRAGSPSPPPVEASKARVRPSATPSLESSPSSSPPLTPSVAPIPTPSRPQTPVPPSVSGVDGDFAGSTRFALRFPRATVFESDIEGYTAMVSTWSAAQTLSMLNTVFSRFDAVARRCGVEKIETIGDAFIVVVFEGRSDPVLDFALQVKRALVDINRANEEQRWKRGGAHHGAQIVFSYQAAAAPQSPVLAPVEHPAAVVEDTEGAQGAAQGEVVSEEGQRSPGAGLRIVPPPQSAPGTPVMSPLSSARSPPLPAFELHLRMGVAMGAAIGGIVGNEVPRFALFGTALEEAVAMEQAGKRDEVVVGRSVYDDAKDRWDMEMSDVIVGDLETYRLIGKKTVPAPAGEEKPAAAG